VPPPDTPTPEATEEEQVSVAADTPTPEATEEEQAQVAVQGEGETVVSGLNSPMGVLIAPDGTIWVIDSGTGGETDLPFTNPQTGQPMTAKFGETAQLIQVGPDGSQTVIANLPSVATGMDTIGGARLVMLDGVIYATVGQWLGEAGSEPGENMAAVVKIENGQVSEVASTWEFEKNNNPDGYLLDSHPFDLAVGPDGQLWLTDAAGNDLLKIDPISGQTELMAVFAGLPGPFPNPGRGGAMESDPVPTGVVVDDSGTVYVGFLSGFPFLPGAAKVVKVGPDGQVSDYATGLSTLTDLSLGPDGELYAVQFAEFSEQGPAPNSGRVIRVREGEASEVVVEGLSFPTAIDFSDNGDAYVTLNGVGAPGSGEVVMYVGLTGWEGSPLPVVEALPTSPATETSPPAETGGATEAGPPAQTQPEPAGQPAEQAPVTLPQSGAARPNLVSILLGLGASLIGLGYLLKPRRKA
jgi:sugar lactone lactonase YvrE